MRKKSLMTIGVFIFLLIISGVILMYKGNDAVALAIANKEGILTAEQIKLSFDSVSGRMINENVKEGQEVHKGDVLMQLDDTDVSLSIQKTQAQIAQLDAQINSMQGTIAIDYAKADTNEQQSFNEIDKQRAALEAAKSTYANKQIDYERKVSLVNIGAISKSDFDNATTDLEVAKANVNQQQEALNKLLSGATDTGNTQNINLPTIAQQRQEAANKANDVSSLEQQRQQLLVQLEELKVQKERLTLKAPEDGKIIKIIAKQGEMISANTPVILLETKRAYYDIYVSEDQAANLHEGDTITGKTVANNLSVDGTIRLIAQAPGFADLKQTREKGQADLSAFQIRIYIEPTDEIKPGMTIGVSDNEFTKR